MLAHAMLRVCGLALAVAPTPAHGRLDVPIFDRNTPGVRITATPLDQYRPDPDRAGTPVYTGVALSGVATPPASAVLGYEDYGTTLSSSGAPNLAPGRHELRVLNTFRFVGGVTSSASGTPVLYFDFFQNDGSPVSTFGVAFPTNGAFVWSIDVFTSGVVVVPTEGYVQIRGDPATSTMGLWAYNNLAPSVGVNDPSVGTVAPGFYQLFDIETESSVPNCAPAGAPFTLDTYNVVGTANNIPWSWSLKASPATAWVPAVDGFVPGVPSSGTAYDVCVAFANSINAWAALQGCGLANLSATAVAGSPDQLRIRTGGTTPFDLYIGPGNVLPSTTPVPVAPASVTFNPTISKLDLSGKDCNANFQDDEVDIATGVSPDINHNGIPDECESPPPTCPGDLDGDNDTDIFDFGIFLSAFGSTGLPPFTGGDLDGDGAVTVTDFAVLASGFGCAGGPLP